MSDPSSGGRPPLPRSRVRSERVGGVWFTRDEAAEVRAAARTAGALLVSWIRAVLLREARTTRDGSTVDASRQDTRRAS